MQCKRFLLSTLAVVSGFIIVFISVASSMGEFLPIEKIDATQHQFYFSHTILPDHIAYPLLMVTDKIQLEMTSSPKKLWLEVEYGWRRLDYARKLLEKNKHVLALTAFTKSQKYFLNTAQEVIDINADNQTKRVLIKHLTLYLSDAKLVAASFDGADKAVAEHLISEGESLKLRLIQSLSK